MSNEEDNNRKYEKRVKVLFYILFFPVVLFVQACGMGLGPAVNESISDSYYYSWNKRKIFYSPMGNWFGQEKSELVGVDLKSFVVLSTDIATDKNVVYGKRTAFPEIDAATFVVKNWIYSCDAGHVYQFRSDSPSSSVTFDVLEGLDPASFEVFVSLGWTKDKNAIYYNDSIVDVDYESFEPIGKYYAKDKNYLYIYMSEDEMHVEPVNTKELVLLNERYIRTQNKLYYTSMQTIDIADVQSVQLLDENWICVDELVYKDGQRVGNPDVNEACFEPVEPVKEGAIYYFRDDKHVYFDKSWKGLITIPQADRETFRLIGEYAADKNYVYYCEQVVEGADPANFRYNPRTRFGKDNWNRYYEGKKTDKLF